MRNQQLDPSLHESGIEIILRAWIALLELLLGRDAGRAERRIHQHDVVPRANELDQRDALRGVVGEQPPPDAAPTQRGLCKTSQRVEQPSLSLLEEPHVVDLREVEFLLSPLWL